MNFAVITAMGSDRVGFVDDVAAQIEQYGCNIEESRMSVLGGEFAMLLLVSGEGENIRKLLDHKEPMERQLDIQLIIKDTPVAPRRVPGRPYIIESFSMDAPGIVHSITRVLKQYEINIEEMETDSVPAPWTGTNMFHLKALVVVPASVHIVKLREELQQFELEQDLDIMIKPAKPNETLQ